MIAEKREFSCLFFCSLCMGLVARTRLVLLELQDTRTLCMCTTQSSPLNRCVCLLACIVQLVCKCVA